MPEVKFTAVTTSRYGGIFRTPTYYAKEGDVLNLSEAEVDRLNRDHPGLIEPLAKKQTQRTEQRPKTGRRRKRTKPAGEDRQVTGGETK